MKRIGLSGVVAILPFLVLAQTPEERGLAIVKEADKRDKGFGDSQVSMLMTLKNQQQDESVRNLRVKTLEQRDDGDKSLTIFDEPRDIKGTALLTFSHGANPDDQWIFLPALARVKRISSSNKSGPFMGSEFAYEDIGSQEVEKYTYKYLRDEVYEEKPTFVIERYPVDENSGYFRQIVWMDQKNYFPVKIKYYDRKNALLKTLELKDYKLYKERFWRSQTMFMKNHQTGKSTTLEWEKYQFQIGLNENDFNSNSLKRAR